MKRPFYKLNFTHFETACAAYVFRAPNGGFDVEFSQYQKTNFYIDEKLGTLVAAHNHFISPEMVNEALEQFKADQQKGIVVFT